MGMNNSYSSLIISNNSIFQQIKSFNIFIKKFIKEIFKKNVFSFFLLNKKFTILVKVDKFYVTYPMEYKKTCIAPMTPQICKITNKTYSSQLLVCFSSHVN